MALDDGWMESALCGTLPTEEADAIFFPHHPKGVTPDYRRAKAICTACPVRTSCLAYAIAHRIPEGVWGARTPGERKQMSRELKVRYRKVWRRMHPLSRSTRL